MTVRHSKVVERAATALENEPRLRGATIDAVDENGIVTLTGTEPSDDVRQLPVMQNGSMAGLLRRRDVVKWLQFHSKLELG